LNDSKRLALFSQKKGQPETREWWSFPIDGSPPRQLNWVRWAGEHRYAGTPNVALSDGSSIATLARRLGENQQLYVVRGDGDNAIGEPLPLTGGASWSSFASVAQGKVVFQSGYPEIGLWMLPADTNQGHVTGALKRINSDSAVVARVSATPGGGTVVFSSNRTGSMNVTVRDMSSGRERVIAADPPERNKNYALIDAGGKKVVYSVSRLDDLTSFDVFEVPLAGGSSRKICDACGPTISLSPDGEYALASRPDAARTRIDVIDTASGKMTTLLQHATTSINTRCRASSARQRPGTRAASTSRWCRSRISTA
jgi:hypothetical protein